MRKLPTTERTQLAAPLVLVSGAALAGVSSVIELGGGADYRPSAAAIRPITSRRIGCEVAKLMRTKSR